MGGMHFQPSFPASDTILTKKPMALMLGNCCKKKRVAARSKKSVTKHPPSKGTSGIDHHVETQIRNVGRPSNHHFWLVGVPNKTQQCSGTFKALRFFWEGKC